MNTLSMELELPGAFFLGAAGAPSRILGMNAEVTPIYPHTTGSCGHNVPPACLTSDSDLFILSVIKI